MLAFLPAPLKVLLTGTLMGLNTVWWCSLIYPFILLKVLVPLRRFQKLCTDIMVAFAENWCTCNAGIFWLTQRIQWDIQGTQSLRLDHSYLVCSNHQAWVDTLVLQKTLNRRIQFLRFFVKQELIYVPLLGGVWFGLDFPFMKRHSKEYLAKHPEKKGEDLAATKKACEKFRGFPIAILNFLEGTRKTPSKYAKQNPPFKHLLNPKAGGVAFVLESMGDQFKSLVDVTIVYPEGPASMVGFFAGRISKVIVRVRELPIPKDLLGGNYLEDAAYREKLQSWIRTLWEEKDQLIESVLTRPLQNSLPRTSQANLQ